MVTSTSSIYKEVFSIFSHVLKSTIKSFQVKILILSGEPTRQFVGNKFFIEA